MTESTQREFKGNVHPHATKEDLEKLKTMAEMEIRQPTLPKSIKEQISELYREIQSAETPQEKRNIKARIKYLQGRKELVHHVQEMNKHHMVSPVVGRIKFEEDFSEAKLKDEYEALMPDGLKYSIKKLSPFRGGNTAISIRDKKGKLDKEWSKKVIQFVYKAMGDYLPVDIEIYAEPHTIALYYETVKMFGLPTNWYCLVKENVIKFRLEILLLKYQIESRKIYTELCEKISQKVTELKKETSEN